MNPSRYSEQDPQQSSYQQQPGHYPGGYAPPPAPVTKPRRWPWVLLGLVLAPILGFAACAALIGSAVSSVSGAAAAVVYEVEGTGSSSSITYGADGSAGIAQENGVTLPWRKEVQFADGALRVATLTAQNASGGDITCRITVDGQVVKELTSSGEFAVVSCNSEAF